jgi:hypothetical protein
VSLKFEVELDIEQDATTLNTGFYEDAIMNALEQEFDVPVVVHVIN